MGTKIEITLFLSIIIGTFLLGYYYEFNAQWIVDNIYTSWYKQVHNETAPTIPPEHQFTRYIPSMHVLGLIWFVTLAVGVSLFLYYVFVERKS
jgi:ABC-type uncharacterized transport system permease subunit